MALLGNLLKEEAIWIIASLQAKHFIGTSHELLRELDQAIIRPDGPSANYSVVSRAAKWMSIHRPQQNRFVLPGGFNDALPESWKPGRLLPLQVQFIGSDELPPGLPIGFGVNTLLQRTEFVSSLWRLLSNKCRAPGDPCHQNPNRIFQITRFHAVAFWFQYNSAARTIPRTGKPQQLKCIKADTDWIEVSTPNGV